MNLDPIRELLDCTCPSDVAALPCPAPECAFLPSGSDRYCDECGTWLGLDGERPPTTGPLKKILINTGALRLVGIVERAEESLNSWCQ
jgi:hypothetical protein